jgi:predicted TIM-barrel fold metal-dependent hydrolase
VRSRELPIVVDHLGDASTADAAWEAGIRALTPYSNVRVKLSGKHVTPTTAAVVLDAIGPDRMLIGTRKRRTEMSKRRDRVRPPGD